MATALSLLFSVDPQPLPHYRHNRHHHIVTHLNPREGALFIPKRARPFLIFPKSNSCTHHLPCSTSPSSPSTSSSTFQYPLHPGRFLANEELEKLNFLENYRYNQELKSGSLWVRAMRQDEMDITVGLLAQSFAESMLLPLGYVKLLEFLVKQYMLERRALMPHAVTLVGFYSQGGGEEGDFQLAGTVEVSFDERGSNASPPTPVPPKNCPYICNMTVKKPLRRMGIGWHLLKASEDLISQMSKSRQIYLHCRMIDAAPFSMYTRAGYGIVKRDSIFVLLTLQRRKYLMRKQLAESNSTDEWKKQIDEYNSGRIR